MNVSQAVKQYIESNGIKQTFLAEKCGWTKQKMSSIITGRKRMGADEMASICDAVGVPYDFFYNRASADAEAG